MLAPFLRTVGVLRSVVAALVVGSLAPTSTVAQEAALPATNQDVFAPLDWPTATTLRSGSGTPGADYWQQEASYAIRVSLDTTAHRVTGTETITYTNHSPDDLRYLWLQLDQNLFAAGSRGSLVNPSNRWRGAFAEGGFDLSRIEVVHEGARYEPESLVNDTRLRLDLQTPLAARGGVIEIEIDWSFVIPAYGADRMGLFEAAAGTVYEMAQWYPRMYVYDDVDGWNPMPYQGQGEFYLDFGTYDVEITVPRNMIVVGTGTVQNPEEVYTEAQQEGLNRARGSASTVMIVDRDEVGAAEARPSGEGPLTWKFRAENVRDFAWAASRAFILDAAGWEDVLLMSAYPAEGLGTDENPGWEKSTEYSRHTFAYYSQQWFRYPYPTAINVAGIVGGMEYPMVSFCSVRARGQGLFGVTDHEFGHNWFPMIVASDERRYAWMDEGFDTFINYYSNLTYYGEEAGRLGRMSADRIAARMQEPIADQPIMTYPDHIRREGLGFLAYRKPGFGLVLLRDVVLGHERFDAAFREYIRRWAFKHPQPADFFRTIEDVSGEDLSWFWRGWFYSTDVLDQAVEHVATGEDGTVIQFVNREGLVMPLLVSVTFADGLAADYILPVELWQHSDRYTLTLDDPRPVVHVSIDPDELLPDIDRANNRWQPVESSR